MSQHPTPPPIDTPFADKLEEVAATLEAEVSEASAANFEAILSNPDVLSQLVERSLDDPDFPVHRTNATSTKADEATARAVLALLPAVFRGGDTFSLLAVSARVFTMARLRDKSPLFHASMKANADLKKETSALRARCRQVERKHDEDHRKLGELEDRLLEFEVKAEDAAEGSDLEEVKRRISELGNMIDYTLRRVGAPTVAPENPDHERIETVSFPVYKAAVPKAEVVTESTRDRIIRECGGPLDLSYLPGCVTCGHQKTDHRSGVNDCTRRTGNSTGIVPSLKCACRAFVDPESIEEETKPAVCYRCNHLRLNHVALTGTCLGPKDPRTSTRDTRCDCTEYVDPASIEEEPEETAFFCRCGHRRSGHDINSPHRCRFQMMGKEPCECAGFQIPNPITAKPEPEVPVLVVGKPGILSDPLIQRVIEMAHDLEGK